MSARGLGLATVLLLLASGASAAATHWGPLASARWAEVGRRALVRGEAGVAREALERAAQEGTDPVALYHLGIARFEESDIDGAVEAWEAALRQAAEPEVRRRANHNLARARLGQALAAVPGEAVPPALESVVSAREALRLKPDAAATRRNLALAMRLLARPDGVEAPTPRDGGVSLAQQSAPGAPGGLSQEQAASILDALQSSEPSDLREMMDTNPGGSWLPRKAKRGPPW